MIMIRETTKERKRRDDRFEGLKRRVMHLARLEGELVCLEEGVFLVRAEGVKNAREIVKRLRSHGVLDRSTLESYVRLGAPLVEIDAHMIATAHRDLRALSQRPALALAHEHRRALARYGTIDEAWLRAKRERIEDIVARSQSSRPLDHHEKSARPVTDWFDGVVELVRAMRGADEAAALAHAASHVHVRADERRKEALERVDALFASLAPGAIPILPAELEPLAARLDAARDLPGRARRRRVLDVLRKAVGWPSAPAKLVETFARQGIDEDQYANLVQDAGRAMVASLPVVRDPALRERSLELIAILGLVFALGDEGMPVLDERETESFYNSIDNVLALASSKLPVAQAVALGQLQMSRATRNRIAGWVAKGLQIELVLETAAKKLLENLGQVPNVRAARAYATWATRLAAHYGASGVSFTLSPDLFTNLPKNEDLGVLAICLMEHLAEPSEAAKLRDMTTDPIAVLDATLALFQRLPAKARGILGKLRGERAKAGGEGRRLYPDFAAWIDDDALLDRSIHVARLARVGETTLLSHAVREDFEHAERTGGERAHLEALATRSKPQQGRLDALLRDERTIARSPKGRTRRRLAERIERLMPKAYRCELDATFREILLEAWDIDVPSLTPAWRDAVRFWLTTDDNHALLGRLLRAAASSKGKDVKRSFPKNEAWLDATRAKLDVDAWCAPRKRHITIEDRRFVIELEEDPLETLRMGIPFATCLALDTGVNAASTVINAIDANKRVLYVRNANGKVVARKLLALSEEGRLIGYNLYVSVAGPEEIAIRTAILETCKALARDVGVSLASTGTPAKIHEGFWYDDGVVAFDEDVDVAAYCTSLGLPPPTKWTDDIGTEARGWRATETGDVDTAVALVTAGRWGLANGELGEWIVDRLGPRATEKRAAEDAAVFVALARSMASAGEEGMVHALDLALRLPEHITQHRVSPLLGRFPPSQKIASAIADMAGRALKRFPKTNDRGLAHLSLSELPEMFDDVAGAFDVLDAVAPTWSRLRQVLPSCVPCCDAAVERSVSVIEAIFDDAPDPDAVIGALTNRRRSEIAQRAALRIAARRLLPKGERAMTRLAVLRPNLAASADGLAALLRQANVDRVTDTFARQVKATNGTAECLEAMRELVARCENLEALLPNGGTVTDLDAWQPGPWELSWRRRRNDALRDELARRASRTPHTVTRAMDLLTMLGDAERLGALKRSEAIDEEKKAASKDTSKPIHESALQCRKTAMLVAQVVQAERRGRIDPKITGMRPHLDAAYADLARRTLLDDTVDEETRAAARHVVLECHDPKVIDRQRLLGACARRREVAVAEQILGETKRRIPVHTVVDVWQVPELRKALAASLAKNLHHDWSARIWSAERNALARGISVEGLLDRLALAFLEEKKNDVAVTLETPDQFRSVADVIAAEGTPEQVAAAYSQLDDVRSVAIFLRALQRQPIDRAAAIREAAQNLDGSEERYTTYRAWMQATSPRPAKRAHASGSAAPKESSPS